MTNEELHKKIIDIYLNTKYGSLYIGGSGGCACLGPSEGEPVCPCAMKSVVRYEDRFFDVKHVLDKEKQVVTFKANELIVPKKNVYRIRVDENGFCNGHQMKLKDYLEISKVWSDDSTVKGAINMKERLSKNVLSFSSGMVMYVVNNYPEFFKKYVTVELM